MSVARARANGAITVVNAIATRRGAAMGVSTWTEARVELVEEYPDVEVRIQGDEKEDPTLAREVVREVCRRLGTSYGAVVETTSDIPISRGLKSSSAAANAIALAANAAHLRLEGDALPRGQCLDAAIDAALRAGVTLTGAYDDASASFLGGYCVTDNAARKLILRAEMPADLVAVVHVPERKVRTLATRDLPYAAIASAAGRAHDLALRGEWADAMVLNGLLFGALYGIDPSLTVKALSRGARAASVSGTGPAFAAVVPRDRAAEVAGAFDGLGGSILTLDLVNSRAEVLP